MKQKIVYTEAPKDISKAIKEGEVVADFLPSIEKLNKKIAQNPIVIDNGNQIRELNRSI